MIKGNYNLLYNTNYIDYYGDEEVEIGKIIDITTDKAIMYIDYDKNLYRKNGYHTCVDVYENEDGEYPVAKIDDLHRTCLFEKPEVFLSLMLHEYGHYKNGDLFLEGVTTEQLKDERLRCIFEGRVDEREQKADAFAVNIVGKNTFLRTLDYLIAMRKKRNDEGMLAAIKEFELRKKAVQRMK